MTGYNAKKAAAQAKLQCQCSMTTKLVGSGCQYCNPEYLYDDDAQPAQESVREALKLALEVLEDLPGFRADIDNAITAIKAALAQRPWVGLTDEEIKAMDAGLASNASFYAGALWAEAKLKDKNT